MTNGQADSNGNWVLLSTVMASSMGFISASALNVVLPRIQQALGASGADILWITNIYLLLLASLILVGGSLGDHYGRKRVFGTGILLFTVASIACGLTPNVEFLLVARVLQGIGGALMIPGSLAIISAYFDDDSRGQAIGVWGAATAVTTVGGPILGGILASAGLWRGVFFINVPLAMVSLWALYRYVPESRDDDAPDQLDYPGAALVTVGLGGLTYGFINAGRTGYTPTNILILVAALIVLAVFVWWEGRTDHPMMPLRLFRSPVFLGANLLTLFLYAGLQGSLFFFSLNLIQAQSYPENVAGFATLPFSLLLVLLSRRMGAIADRIGSRIPLTIGTFITGAGFALLALPGLTAGATAYWTTYFPGMFVLGLGMAIVVTPLTTAVMSSVPQNSAGTASGINNAASRAAGVLATAVIGAIVLLQFTTVLETRIDDLGLSAESREALLAQSEELGNTQVPESVDDALVPEVEQAIRLAFVDTFRIAVLIGAGLAWVSTVCAFFLLRMSPQESKVRVQSIVVQPHSMQCVHDNEDQAENDDSAQPVPGD